MTGRMMHREANCRPECTWAFSVSLLHTSLRLWILVFSWSVSLVISWILSAMSSRFWWIWLHWPGEQEGLGFLILYLTEQGSQIFFIDYCVKIVLPQDFLNVILLHLFLPLSPDVLLGLFVQLHALSSLHLGLLHTQVLYLLLLLLILSSQLLVLHKHTDTRQNQVNWKDAFTLDKLQGQML